MMTQCKSRLPDLAKEAILPVMVRWVQWITWTGLAATRVCCGVSTEVGDCLEKMPKQFFSNQWIASFIIHVSSKLIFGKYMEAESAAGAATAEIYFPPACSFLISTKLTVPHDWRAWSALEELFAQHLDPCQGSPLQNKAYLEIMMTKRCFVSPKSA